MSGVTIVYTTVSGARHSTESVGSVEDIVKQVAAAKVADRPIVSLGVSEEGGTTLLNFANVESIEITPKES